MITGFEESIVTYVSTLGFRDGMLFFIQTDVLSLMEPSKSPKRRIGLFIKTDIRDFRSEKYFSCQLINIIKTKDKWKRGWEQGL